MYAGDDLVFAKALDNQSLVTFLKGRYMWWTSRIIMESVMMPIQVYVPHLWYFLNALISAFIITYTPKFITQTYSNWVGMLYALLLLTVIPINAYGGSGWITCTINYVWAWACGLLGMYPLVCMLRKEKMSVWIYILSLPACFFAMNNEQFSALSMGVLVFFVLFISVFQKRFAYQLLPHIAIIIWSLRFILKSNGNIGRLAYETDKYMPEFSGFTTVEKMLNGFCNTIYVYINGFEKQYALIVLAVALLVYFTVAHRKKYLAVFPTTVIIMAVVPKVLFELFRHDKWHHFLRFLDLLWNNRLFTNREGTLPILQIVYYLIVIVLLIMSLLLAGKSVEEKIIYVVVFLAAIAETVIFGFSPTIIISGERTFLFGSFMLVALSVRFIEGTVKVLKEKYKPKW